MKTNERISFIDILRWVGITLVYYAHFLDKLITIGYWDLLWQKKLIYSFHMPLFFFLSGIFWNPDKASTLKYIQHRAISLLVPGIFWRLVYLPIWWASIPQDELIQKAEMYLAGNFDFLILVGF